MVRALGGRAAAALICALAWPAAALAADAPRRLPAEGPRDAYEQSLGRAPVVYQPPGGLGHDWAGTPPYVANAAAYSGGELIASDTPFDDSGADTQPGNGDGYGTVLSVATLPGVCGGKGATGAEPPLSRHGDHAYASPELRDTADLVELRVAADGDSYYFAALLETMSSDHDAAVQIGVTGPGEPGGTGTGIDAFRHRLEITPKGATVDGTAVALRIDVAGHVLEARVPRSLLPGGTWQLAAAAQEWRDGAPGPVTDLAHVGDEPLVGVAN